VKPQQDPIYNSPILGYAHHRIILDEDGFPFDYEFLEINRTFEKITGLIRGDTIGKTVRGLIPDIGKSEFDWIRCYGDIALNGGEKEIEQFSEHLKRWYRIHVFSTERLYFTTLFIDITDSKREKEELERFFSVNLDLLCIANFEGKFLKLNEAWTRMLGYSREELMEKQFLEFVHPDDVEKTVKVIQHLTKREDVVDFVNRYRSKDGSYRHIEWRSHTEGDLIYAAARDITDRIEAESKLSDERSRLAGILEGTRVGTWEWNIQTGETIYNERWANILGYKLEELSPVSINTWIKFSHPEDLKKSGELLEKHFKGELDYYECESRMLHKNGEWIWVLDRGQVARWDQDGKPLLMMGTHQDITIQKNTETRLRQTLAEVEHFRSLVESSSDCFYMVDLDDNARMVYANDAALRHFGVNREEIYKWHVNDWDPNFSPETIPDLVRLIENQKTLHMESLHHIADGSIVPVEISVNYRKDDHGRRFAYGWFSNITTRKTAQEELRKAKELAESANKAKSEFLANMSHEIRTPLNSVIGFTDLLKNTRLSPVQRQYVDYANVSGHALLGVINEILDFSKIEAGVLELEAIRTDFIELIENSIDIVRHAADRKGLEFLLNLHPDIPRFATVDPVRLKQILANLLSNAVKFTEHGEIELKVTYQPIKDGRGQFHIAVRDTGIGISTAQTEKLFKAFSQADSSTTRKFGGTGLGLIISDMIAQKMGSKILVSSEPDKGSIFFFDFTTEVEFAPKRDTKRIHGIKRCMVIEDNDTNRIILDQMLKQWDIVVDSYSNGTSAIAKLRHDPDYDVIICDYHMPRFDGLDAVHYIRENLSIKPDRLPVILLHSASNDPDLHRKCESMGVRFLLSKPVKPDELFEYLSVIRSPEAAELRSPVATGNPALLGNAPFDVLIVEDVELNMMLIKAVVLRDFPKFRIFEARDGIAALDLYQSRPLDIILMDVQMPGMDGLEATRRIREMESETGEHVPIIALTAGAYKEEQERCFKAGMDDFLQKPIDQIKLQRILSTLASGKTTNSGKLHFNYPQLIESLGDEIAKSIAEHLIEHVPVYLDSVKTAIESNDPIELAHRIHSLKGACLNGELTHMATLAKEMEKQVSTSSVSEMLHQKLEDIQTEWLQAEKALKHFCEREFEDSAE